MSSVATSGFTLSQILTLYARGRIDRQHTSTRIQTGGGVNCTQSHTRHLANVFTDTQMRAGTSGVEVGSVRACRTFVRLDCGHIPHIGVTHSQDDTRVCHKCTFARVCTATDLRSRRMSQRGTRRTRCGRRRLRRGPDMSDYTCPRASANTLRLRHACVCSNGMR